MQQSLARQQGAAPAARARPFTPVSVQRGALQVTNAITRTKKEQIVSNIKDKLDGSMMVFGFRHAGLSVPTVQKFRKGLPEGSSVFVCKNSLMKVALTQTKGWEALADGGCTGENAWVFVKEDDIADAVKHYFKFEKDLFEDAKKVAAKGVEVKSPTSVTSVIMSGKIMTAAELKKCESLPTKLQLLATIARMARTPATKLATSIKMVPTKLAVAIKKVSELDEDKTKSVASMVKA